MIRKSLHRPTDFTIEELDTPIQGTNIDNEWFNVSLIGTLSGDPKYDIINKFLKREEELKSLAIGCNQVFETRI